ncbi:MAG: type I-G CRISPR-associated helicase/endonuclease Cas3g [Solirubrobacteraceae bacterium]
MISFADFLRRAHGADIKPYSWQARLAERCAEGEPPPAVAVPTGAGKTVTVDALVWALACQAERPAAQRTVGIRIVWAIDRRILVDEVHEHAASLAATLAQALEDRDDALHEMAQRLAALSDGDVPLVATRWRGGLEARPERCGPLQPQVITSTIAQIGSRLLFRGYGVGQRSLALEAGLAACDTTICLDEAHLAQPFRETVKRIREHRRATEQGLELPGLRAIMLTATPPREAPGAIVLDEQDRVALGSRFYGKKRARLLAGEGEYAQAKLLVASTLAYVREGMPTVACVVNTVRRARAVFDALRKQVGDEVDLALLIGPQRPVDRDRVLEEHRATLFDGVGGERPLICVATQTFEVGLDADVAAIVTESASATALVQRLGRLNRRGLVAGQATIVRDEGRWLYAEDEPAAWAWLEGLADEHGTIDVSVAALTDNPPPQPSNPSYAATLTLEIVERLAETSRRPGAYREPDPDAFLRGPEAEVAAEVALCWRADLRPDLAGRTYDEYRTTLLKLVPPQRQELLTLSLAAARSLLAARYSAVGARSQAARVASLEADIEDAGGGAAEVHELLEPERTVPFLVIRGDDVHRGTLDRRAAQAHASDRGETVFGISELRAGDVLVLPTLAGGVDDHGLAPGQPRVEHATDVAADRRGRSHRSAAPEPVRLTPEALASDGGQLPAAHWRRVAEACAHAEGKILSSGREDREQTASKLVEQLRAETFLYGHPGLKVLAESAIATEGWTVALRSITRDDPNDPDGSPQLDEADFGADTQADDLDSEDAVSEDEVEQEAEADARSRSGPRHERIKPERVWVLLPIRTRAADELDRRVGEETKPPSIEQHALAVSEAVRESAELLQLTPVHRDALVLAARAHDHGKADPRTQAFYRRGVHALAGEPIAKSEFGTRDRRTARIASRLAGLPRHQRHEIASVAVLEDALTANAIEMPIDCLDSDFALHLVGVHHGLGRPVPEVPEGGRAAQPFAIATAGVAGTAIGDGRDGWADGAWLERFWRVFERYGPWGAAYLEALLTLSDRAVSAGRE